MLPRYVLLACAVLFMPWAQARIELQNPLWRIELEPATLAIRVTPRDGDAVQASAGGQARRVGALSSSAEGADWQWDDGAFTVNARLQQRELLLSISAREAGSLTFLEQPGSAMGRGLLWPLTEGRYVPRGDRRWQAYLLDYGAINTTQDLSLPLWGSDHGNFSLHWLLTNPFNNRLHFRAEGEALGLSASHEFTALKPDEPLTLRLYLGDADPLAGAKRYRQWLMETGRYESLGSKLLASPQARQLLGASHIYLWGNDLLGAEDVRDWGQLLQALASGPQGSLAAQLRERLDAEAAQVLASASLPLTPYQRDALLGGVNRALNQQARQLWRATDEPDLSALGRAYGQVRARVAGEFAVFLAPDPQGWGAGLSLRTLEQLKSTGLPRLWLGLGDGWEGGLWHPETVRAMVAAGYLVAPYDSYQTALATAENPDWVTAHLGTQANRDCAIVLRDGQPKRGFQQAGHYTDPRCVRPLLQARTRAVQESVGFNSWFLDAYATGMLFDSYRRDAPMTQAQQAQGNIAAARWVGETLQLPVGSEDGNAVTAQGILFAHGMQTPVIGWGDADFKDKQSPYYLGNWYPPQQPSVFFRPAPLKEPYRSLHFAPATRLPLYQAVFHGSVITSHHWLFDNLKLSNVRVENELTQLLYNVPPLYHLSAATLKQRLALIQRHDRFFRPLHQRLATQVLTDFRWLSADRQVQQTTFADGTRLVANFTRQRRKIDGRDLPGHSITAFVADGRVMVYRAD